MAPELIRVEPAGPAADVFCLAACFARWHFGRYPFAGDTFLERLVSVSLGRLHPELAIDVLPEWVQRGLSPDPASRPALTDA